MNVDGKPYRTIWVKESDAKCIQIIDQRKLPHAFVVEDITTVEQAAIAIKDMHVRGAGLIGATAAFGIYLATLEAAKKEDFEAFLHNSAEQLIATRPTAVNLSWAVNLQLKAISTRKTIQDKIEIAFKTAQKIADEDAENCRKIGLHGLSLIEKISKKKGGKPVNILTHCNAGWLAFVDYGSATAPIYEAHNRGINVHVWVDETRPRNQGAKLTAWELGKHGVPHTIIADNTGGHLIQHAMVDMVIVGTDRTTRAGDVANKIGTYLKALAAKDNGVPFYVSVPSSSIDWEIKDGIKEIEIEERGAEEVKIVDGIYNDKVVEVRITPENSPVANYGFDVTPARLVTALITERGICKATEDGVLALFPEKQKEWTKDI